MTKRSEKKNGLIEIVWFSLFVDRGRHSVLIFVSSLDVSVRAHAGVEQGAMRGQRMQLPPKKSAKRAHYPQTLEPEVAKALRIAHVNRFSFFWDPLFTLYLSFSLTYFTVHFAWNKFLFFTPINQRESRVLQEQVLKFIKGVQSFIDIGELNSGYFDIVSAVQKHVYPRTHAKRRFFWYLWLVWLIIAENCHTPRLIWGFRFFLDFRTPPYKVS